MSNNYSNKIHGVLGEYETVDEILSAAATVRASGYTKWDCYTPLPVHGLDAAMGVKETRLPWVVLLAGLAGGGLGLLMQFWMNGIDYKLIISGKPMNSLPSSVPVMFETTVLFACVTAFVSMWLANGLPKWFNPLSRLERFARSTDDRFFIALSCDDPNFDVHNSARMLSDAGASAVEVVEEPDESSALPGPVKGLIAAISIAAIIPLVLIVQARGSITKDPRIHLVPDMDFQEKFGAQSTSNLFADGRAARPQIAGTYAAEDDALVGNNPALYTGKEDGAYVEEAPIASSEEVVARGHDRFNIYCAPCHGLDANGQGPIDARAKKLQQPMWVQPTDLFSPHLGFQPIGQWFESISAGVRNMPGYAKTISAEDRWAIAHYLKAIRVEKGVDVPYTGPPLTPEEEAGRVVFMQTCAACHTTNGTPLLGPSFKDWFGSERELQDGSSVTADEAYIRESVANPNAQIAKGFQPIMVTAPIPDADMANLITYLKSLSN